MNYYKMTTLTTWIVLLFSTSAYTQSTSCKDFKNGNFEISNDQMGLLKISRQGSEQIEYIEKAGIKFQYEVKWLNECTYTLKLVKILESPKGYQLPKEAKSMILTINIIETKDKSYIQKTSSNIYDIVQTNEVFVVE